MELRHRIKKMATSFFKNYKNALFLIPILVGILLDFIVTISGAALIVVNATFISSIYSSIVAISILSFSLIALISGFLNFEFYGYELREILNFPNSPVKMKKFILLSLVIVMIATLGLVANYLVCFTNTMIALLIEAILLVGYTGIGICKLIFSKEECTELVKQYYSTMDEQKSLSYDLFCKNLDKLIEAWKSTIEEYDSVNKDVVWDMLENLCEPVNKLRLREDDSEGGTPRESYYKYYDYFDKKIRTEITRHSLAFGYFQMVKDVINLYDKIGASRYDRRDVYAVPLDEIKFYDDNKILNLNIFTEIMSIPYYSELYGEDGKITPDDMEWIYDGYFNALINNSICKKKSKEKLVKEYICQLSQSETKEVTGKLLNQEQIVLLNIMQYRVFQNKKLGERKFIYERILLEIFSNNQNRYKRSRERFNYLSIIIQMAYAYSTLETETLTKTYRENIKELITADMQTANIETLNLGVLVKNDIKSILTALASRIEGKNGFTKRYEYFPRMMFSKTTIWNEEFDIWFFFALYFVYNRTLWGWLPIDFFKGFENLTVDEKKKIIDEGKRFFNSTGKALSDNSMKIIEDLGGLLKNPINIPRDIPSKLYNSLNKYDVSIVKELADATVLGEPCKEDVYKELAEIMKREDVYGWDSGYSNENPIPIRAPERICKKNSINAHLIAQDLKYAIKEAINRYIERSEKLDLSFDSLGLKTMAEFLEKTSYDTRNYTFTDDLSWEEETRESETFKKIIDLNSKIELIRTNDICSRFYCLSENFKYNINITECQINDLESEEIEDYLKQLKTYNGLYNIEGALFSKTEAVEIVEKMFCRQSVAFGLMVSFKLDEIKHIEFTL